MQDVAKFLFLFTFYFTCNKIPLMPCISKGLHWKNSPFFKILNKILIQRDMYKF
jgi:hypothetical protein